MKPRLIFISIVLPLILAFEPVLSSASEAGPAGISGVCSSGGVVVSASSEATEAGVRILNDGGTAMDAAVAVGFALAVAYPRAGNLGGGGFMLIREADGEENFIDFREKAPLASSRDMYLDQNGDVIEGLSTRGYKASGVPGTVAGLSLAHRGFCRIRWESLLAPAINLAENGFALNKETAKSINRLLTEYGEDFPGLRKFHAGSGDKAKEGNRLCQPELAATLRRLSEKGGREFYRGETARLIVDEMKRGGGLITLEDLKSYSAEIRKPVEGAYRGYRIISAPPPSSGGTVLLEILNILEGYPLSGYGPLSEEAVHLMVEAERIAYRDRARYLGDADYVEVPVTELISKSYGSRMREAINPDSAGSSEMKNHWKENSETTHYSVIDRFGNAVSATITLNGSYGSKVVVRGAGFLMNNEMDDFSMKPGVPNMYGLVGGRANEIAPGKRMLSSMAPTIVIRDGRVFMVLGSPGGSTIITSVAQVIINILDFGMEPGDAVSWPRFHHQYLPDLIYHEDGAFTDRLEKQLKNRGHKIKARPPIGDIQLIIRQGGTACGYTDPRLYGSAAAGGSS